jgi:hypothetical protein
MAPVGTARKAKENGVNSDLRRGMPSFPFFVAAALNRGQRRTMTLIGAPPHAARLLGKRTKWVAAAAAAESHPDFLRPFEATDKRVFLLALVSQLVAIPACEQFPSAVQDRNPPPAVSAIRTHRTNEPGTPATKMAIAPSDRHALLDGFPLGG